MSNHSLHQRLIALGEKLNFDVRTEVEASESAWVDIAWFDKRLPVGAVKTKKMRRAPVLPIVAFEVELNTGLNAKHVKGSVSNLNVLGALLGIVVIGNGNIDALAKKPAQLGKGREELQKILRDRVERWIYTEAQPKGRVIVMLEDDVADWTGGIESQLTNKVVAGTQAVAQ